MDTFPWIQLLTIGVPAVVSIGSAIWASRSASRARAAEHEAQRMRALEERVAERKYAMYEPFLKAFGDALTPSRSEDAMEGMEDVMADFQSVVSIWASDEVVEAFFRFRTASTVDPPSRITTRLMADFLLAVRRDIAWPQTKIDGLRILGMRINDIHKQPDLRDALTRPFQDLCAELDWTPPFPIPEAPTTKIRSDS